MLEESASRSVLRSFYAGIYFVLFVFFAVFSVALKTKNILIYGLLFTMAVFSSFHSYGYLSVTFDSYLSLHFAIFPAIFISLSLLHMLFALSFLNLRTLSPRTYRFVIIYMGVDISIYLVSFFFPSDFMNGVRVVALGGLLAIGICLVAKVIMDRIAGSVFFGLGFAIFLYWVLASLFSPTYMSAEATAALDATTIFGQVAEALVFGAAIVQKSWAVRRQRDASLKAELAVANEKIALEKELHDATLNLKKVQSDYRRMATTRHDLRQPLTSLRLAVEQTENSELAKKLRAGIDYMASVLDPAFRKESARHAEKASKQESIPLQLVLDNLERIYGDEANEKGLKLKFHPTSFQTNTNIIILIRMVSNLLSNAIKYTESGGILVGVRRHVDGLRVEVWDTGPGLSPSEIKRLFKPYERGVAESDHAGEGLGLAIVSESAAQLGLQLSVKSKAGKGSVFAVGNLPRA